MILSQWKAFYEDGINLAIDAPWYELPAEERKKIKRAVYSACNTINNKAQLIDHDGNILKLVSPENGNVILNRKP